MTQKFVFENVIHLGRYVELKHRTNIFIKNLTKN